MVPQAGFPKGRSSGLNGPGQPRTRRVPDRKEPDVKRSLQIGIVHRLAATGVLATVGLLALVGIVGHTAL